MLPDKRFYVYVHRRRTDDKIFYVGKGQGRRSGKTQGRNIFWVRVSSKHGWKHEKVFFTDNEPCSFTMEKIQIFIGRKLNVMLTNSTDGGEGCSGNVLSESAKEKISIANKGKNRFGGVRNFPSTIVKQSIWWHKDGEIFRGDHVALHEKTQIPLKRLKAVETGLKYSYFGWKVAGVRNYPEGRYGIHNKMSDLKIYNFYKNGFPNFIGTRVEFNNFYNLNSCQIGRVVSGDKKSYKGWRVNAI